jgi:hypothetical protein
MASLEHLDLLLGQALECVDEAAHEVRELGIPEREEILRYIGSVVGQLWGVREILYKIKPELKRDFVKEIEQNKTRWEELHEIALKAGAAEGNGKINDAMNLFNELLTTSRFGYFRLIAEAGLYRLSKMQERKSN